MILWSKWWKWKVITRQVNCSLEISVRLWVEEEINDVSANDKTPMKRLQPFNPCYKCGKTGHFQKNCPGNGDEENMEPQHKIIGTVTHTIEAQTPVTDKSLSDFMYKNFKQTEMLKKKYTAAKMKLKKTKQELEEVKSGRHDPVFTTAKNTSPKKTVTFAKNTMPWKPAMKGKAVTKGITKNKPNKTTAPSVTTSMGTVTKAKVKMEPVSVIETEDTSDDNEGEDTENVTEIDTDVDSSSSLMDSDSDE